MFYNQIAWAGSRHAAFAVNFFDCYNWRVVRYYYDIWAEEDDDGISLLDRMLRKLVEMERKNNDRSEKTTMIIVDSKSVQNADTAQSKGYDAGKKLQE